MWRWIALTFAFALLVTAVWFWTRPLPNALPVPQPAQVPVPPMVMPAPDAATPVPPAVAAPAAPASSSDAGDDAAREAKRFARVDKDHDKVVTQAEFLALRRKAFAKLDADKKPVTGSDGLFVQDRLLFYTAMARGAMRTDVQPAVPAACAMPATSVYSHAPIAPCMMWFREFMPGPSVGPSQSSHSVVAGSTGWLNVQPKDG